MAPKRENAASTKATGAARQRAVIDIEDLMVWVYQKQQAHRVARVGLFDLESAVAAVNWRRVSGDGCARAADIAALGCSVDAFGSGNGALAEDAEIVHAHVCKLSSLEVGLIVACGASASRPDWSPGAVPQLGPKYNGGRVLVIRDKNRDHGYCPIQWKLSHETIELKRGQYALWRQSLERLVPVLRARLVDHDVRGPRAQAAPWLDLKQAS